jgi:hypothetical protein
MNVVRHTATELVVHEGIFATVLVGTVFATAGGGVITAFHTDRAGWSGGGAAIVYPVGGLFILIGLVLLVLSADRRFEFDGVTRTARMIVRRLVHRTVAEYPFDTLSGVALERSSGSSRSQVQNFRGLSPLCLGANSGSRPLDGYPSRQREQGRYVLHTGGQLSVYG